MEQSQWIGFVSAAVISVALQPVFLQFLRRQDVLDIPNERSSHTVPTPRGGGWGIVAAVAVVVFAGWLAHGYETLTLALTGCMLIAAVGGVDDLRGLAPVSRLGWQVATAVLIVLGSLAVAGSSRGPGTVMVCVVIVVAYVNAFNFMDGINGISAFSALIAASWLGLLAVDQAELGLAWLAAALAGSCAGFLPWNFPAARIFLGDIGSYFVGAVLAALALAVWSSGAALIACVAPFVLYLFDTGVTLVRRAWRGESLTQAHRDHLYQQMSRSSGHTFTALVTAVLTVACIVAAEVLVAGAWPFGLFLFLGILTAYVAASFRPAVAR